jgi:hypothetical protein
MANRQTLRPFSLPARTVSMADKGHAMRLPANIVQDTLTPNSRRLSALTLCLFGASKSDLSFAPKHMAQATFRELLLPR